MVLSGVPAVCQWCSGGVPCLGGVSVSHCWSGRVSVVRRWCPSGVPVLSRWCAGGVAMCAVVFWWCPGGWCQSCPGGVAVASRGVPVVSSGVPVVGVPVVSRWCPSVVPVASRSYPRAPWVLVVFHHVPPSGVPAVSGVPRGGVPVPTTISENLRLWGGWCPVGEVVGGVAVGR